MSEPKWAKLSLTMKFREQGVAGSLPAKDLAERYSDLAAVQVSNEIKKAFQEEGIATKEDVDKYLEGCTSVFSVDEGGFYLRPVQFIGMLCMSAARTKLSIQRRGMRATLIQGTTIVEPNKIYLKSGKLTTPSRALTPQNTGKSTIKRTMVLENTVPFDVNVKWLDNGDISMDDMEMLLTVGQEIGIGGDRRFGYGKFDITKMTRVNGTEVAELVPATTKKVRGKK
ncbi:hypothetical protein MUP59_06835 [Candidatus Bathyarchaeota archaeon]|nr:hypothetical protein [Candidatus Bathyarchaeota archaeon]